MPAIRLALAAAVTLAAAGEADAQVLGIRVSSASASGTNLNIVVNALMTPAYPYSTAFIGVGTFFGAPIAPAIEWGDGATVPFPGYPSTGIPVTPATTFAGTPVRSYRGSFSHSYAAPGAYTVRVRSFFYAPATPITGNAAIVNYYGYPVTVATNAISVSLSAIGLPTMSSLGLLALALLLGTAGWLQLRRASTPAGHG